MDLPAFAHWFHLNADEVADLSSTEFEVHVDWINAQRG